jgi:glycosyltransferase involved in cell wall biosynthesis
MENNTFSVIIPTWNRGQILAKAIQSVLNQTYKHFELIIVDDGSTDDTQQVINGFNDHRIRVIKHDKCQERVISWNDGMRAANNDWICFLDSDDEWIYGYLEIMNHNINLHPEYKMFHFGQTVFSMIGTTHRNAPDLEEDPETGWGMKHFDTGRVGAGAYIFKRSCLENITWMPEISDLHTLANWFGQEVKKYWDERRLLYPYPLYNDDDRWCGNPWGQDYVLAWLVSRKYKSKKIPVNPYIAYIRTEPWLSERPSHTGGGTL